MEFLCLALLLCLLVPSNSNATCGQRSFGTRIVGGETAIPNSWPWQLSLRNPWRIHMCGATLINSRWAVTAAHCVKGSQYTILAGAHHMYNRGKLGTVVRVSKTYVHEGYGKNGKQNDIALLKFFRPLKFSSRIRPACLPKQGQRIAPGESCYITGWGRVRDGETGLAVPDYLQQSKVPHINHEQCRKVNGDIVDERTMVCVGGAGSSACYADSGGPLVCEERGRWVLFGATSFGVSKICAGDKYSVYVRVSNYIDWIEKIIGKPIQPTQFLTPPPTQSPPLKTTALPMTTMGAYQTSSPMTQPETCRDTNSNCSRFYKYCKYNSWVQRICKKTCNKCKI